MPSGNYAGKSGVVRAVSSTAPSATVFLEQIGQTVTIPIDDLRPQLAKEGSYARILSGKHAGKKFLVINTVGMSADGKFDDDADVVLDGGNEITEVLPPTVVVACDPPQV